MSVFYYHSYPNFCYSLKSLYSQIGYSGYKYEQTYHYVIVNNSLMPGCTMPLDFLRFIENFFS